MTRGIGRRARRSGGEWKKLIDAFDRSELSVPAFCDQHQLGYSTFRKWRRHLSKPLGAMPETPLIELTRLPSPSPAWDVELELGSGVVLRVRRS
jgi:hypothetical protein